MFIKNKECIILLDLINKLYIYPSIDSNCWEKIHKNISMLEDIINDISTYKESIPYKHQSIEYNNTYNQLMNKEIEISFEKLSLTELQYILTDNPLSMMFQSYLVKHLYKDAYKLRNYTLNTNHN